eukprot:752111-Hanusia_phi.AAC.1
MPVPLIPPGSPRRGRGPRRGPVKCHWPPGPVAARPDDHPCDSGPPIRSAVTAVTIGDPGPRSPGLCDAANCPISQ